MPIYEYQCKACEHYFDALQKMADAPLLDCPQCSKPELTKLVSAASFKLKGSGWYETDFKNNGRAPADSGAQAKRDTADKGGAYVWCVGFVLTFRAYTLSSTYVFR